MNYSKTLKNQFLLTVSLSILTSANLSTATAMDCSKANLSPIHFKANTALERYNLGLRYYYGKNDLSQNYEHAFTCFQAAAKESYPLALIALGRMYQAGHWVNKNIEYAHLYYTLAAKQNCAEANQFLKSKAFTNFKPTDNPPLFSYINLNTCDGGYHEISEIIGNPIPSILSLETIKEQVAKKDVKAIYALGYAYYKGNEIDQTYTMANEYFKNAADKGLPEAQFAYARACLLGLGTNKDIKLAYQYFKKAADQGLAIAQFQLAKLISSGKGIVGDNFLSTYYYKKAADQRLAAAQFLLGFRYEMGAGITQDYKMAHDYYQSAIKQGLQVAKNNLASMYIQGQHVKQNKKIAFKLYKEAADEGSVFAQHTLGQLYSREDLEAGVKKDYNKAFQYFQLAADQGLIEAQLKLAHLYFFGYGCAKDIDKALELLRSSCMQDKSKLNTLEINALALEIMSYFSGDKEKYMNNNNESYCIEKLKILCQLAEIETLITQGGAPRIRFTIGYIEKIRNPESSTNHLIPLLEKAESSLKKERLDKKIESLEADASSESFCKLGLMYYKGEEVTQDNKIALEYFKKAYKSLDSNCPVLPTFLYDLDYESCCAIGDIFFNGKGTEINYKTANLFYNLADTIKTSYKKSDDVNIKIGTIYLQGGYGIDQNLEQAEIFLHKPAVENNNYEAQMLLASHHLKKENIKAAFKYIKLASKHNAVETTTLINTLIQTAINSLNAKYDVDHNNHYDHIQILLESELLGFKNAIDYLNIMRDFLSNSEQDKEKMADFDYLSDLYFDKMELWGDHILSQNIEPMVEENVYPVLNVFPVLDVSPVLTETTKEKKSSHKKKKTHSRTHVKAPVIAKTAPELTLQITAEENQDTKHTPLARLESIAPQTTTTTTTTSISNNTPSVSLTGSSGSKKKKTSKTIRPKKAKRVVISEVSNTTTVPVKAPDSPATKTAPQETKETKEKRVKRISLTKRARDAVQAKLEQAKKDRDEKRKERAAKKKKITKEKDVETIADDNSSVSNSVTDSHDQAESSMTSERDGDEIAKEKRLKRQEEKEQQKKERSQKRLEEKKLKEALKKEKEQNKLDKKKSKRVGKLSNNNEKDKDVSESQSQLSESATESFAIQSHFDISAQDSESVRSRMSESESIVGEEKVSTMKADYPQLEKKLRKSQAKYLGQISFKRDKETIIATLRLMRDYYGLIKGYIGDDKIEVHKIDNADICFRPHTSHGSSLWSKWWHNPAISKAFLTFGADCDPIIKAHCLEQFGQNCFATGTFELDDMTANDGGEGSEDSK